MHKKSKIGGEGSSLDIGAGSSDKAASDIDVISKQLSDNTIADTKTNADVRKPIFDFEELLFRDPPPKDDCPICMLPMPYQSGVCEVEKIYMVCCGKILCKGCVIAAEKEMDEGNLKEWCPLCRVPIPKSNKEAVNRIKKRMRSHPNDADALLTLGTHHQSGECGLRKNNKKALELYNQAAKLGSVVAHYALAQLLPVKEKKRIVRHTALAAIRGHELARCVLWNMETRIGRSSRAMKHYIIAAKAGEDCSLKKVGEGFKAGLVTKELMR